MSTVPVNHKIGELNTQVTSGFYTHKTHNGRTGIGKPLQKKGGLEEGGHTRVTESQKF